jgi:hypothetical protein
MIINVMQIQHQGKIFINMLDIGIRILYLYLSLANTIVKNISVRKMTV